MQFSFPVILTIAASLVCAAPVEKRSSSKAPVLVNFSVERFDSDTKAPVHGYTKSVSSVVDITLENEYALYLTDLEVGTPSQKLRVDIDTGSSDLWVPAANTTSNSGAFNYTQSTSYKQLNSNFRIGYGDGSYAIGDWAKDTVTLGGAVVENFRFGYGVNQTAKQAIMGVGLPGNEASYVMGVENSTYPNFPQALKDSGIIDKVAYSLWLNSVDAQSGSILFGGIDHAKYEGDLKTLPLVNIDDSGAKTDEPVAFFVDLDKIGDSTGTTYSNKSHPALLDSGTTLIYAPNDIAEAFGKKNGHKVPFVDAYFTSCDKEGEPLEFTFGDKVISIPFKDLLFRINGKKDSHGFLGQCMIGMMGSSADYYILGDNFLRSAYVYYDLEDKQIGIAQAKYTTESQIQIV